MPWDDHSLRRVRQSVLPVQGPRGPIGTGTVIAAAVVLTALHVIAPEITGHLGFGHTTSTGRGLAVCATATLSLRRYGADRELAECSRERAQRLTGSDTGTVDLALLAVPGLRAPALPIRAAPLHTGEHVIVPGYPGGQWSISRGPVIGCDAADFTVHLLLGPGASGAPAIDHAGQLAGVVTLDNEAGTICIGPRLVAVFLRRMRAEFARGQQ
jgi:hypothetical protein